MLYWAQHQLNFRLRPYFFILPRIWNISVGNLHYKGSSYDLVFASILVQDNILSVGSYALRSYILDVNIQIQYMHVPGLRIHDNVNYPTM